jgi:type IV pilus assembly protein PilY1
MRWSIPGDMATVDTTDSGYIDRVYVGDMRGQLWRFDIGDPDPTRWTGQILFNANSPIDGSRKIFYQPDVTLEEGYEIVFFGTGDRAHPRETTVINRIYGLKDKGTGVTLDEDDLIDETDDLLQDPSYSGDKASLRTQILNGNGWYIRLVDNLGEKVLAPSVVFAGVAYFTTYTSAEPTVDPCDSFSEGTARLYALDYRTGEAALNYDTSDEALARADRSKVSGSSIPSALVLAIVQGQPLGYIGVRGGILNPEIAGGTAITRIYWRQLF